MKGNADEAPQRRGPLSRHSEIRSGQTCFAGTRVPVGILLSYFKEGETVEAFLLGYPSVSRWQINAILAMPREHARTLAAKYARPRTLPQEPNGRKDES